MLSRTSCLFIPFVAAVLLLSIHNFTLVKEVKSGSPLLRSDSPSDLSSISVSHLDYNVLAAELRNLSIRFFVYEEPYDLVQASHVEWFRGGKGKLLYRKRFSAEATQEVQVLETLRKHPLRTMDKSNANLFVVPFPVGAVLIKGSGGKTFKSLAVALLNATTFLEQPHVLLSLTTVGFNQRHRKYTGGDQFYRDVAPLIVAQSWASHGNANVSHQGTANGHDYHGMFLQLSHAMSKHGFSIGLLPRADLPYHRATYDKFQNAKNFMFYQTRTRASDWNSTRFRQILLEPSVMNQLNWTNSSIGYGLPPDEWLREFSSSKFCAAIRGDTPHTHALLNAVRVGCIPVVISDFYPMYAPSFPSTLKMEDYCVFIPEDDFIRDPAKELLRLMDLSEGAIRRKLEGLAFAQKVVLIDHPESLFVQAFLKESLFAYENPIPSELRLF